MPIIEGALLRCALLVRALVGTGDDALYYDRVSVCAEVVTEATHQRADAALAVAIAWQESRFTHADVNPWNCAGPMQAKVHYWCPNINGEWSATAADGILHDCDLTAAGVRALRYYAARAPREYDMLCLYSWGKCDTPQRRRYVRRTQEIAQRARALGI